MPRFPAAAAVALIALGLPALVTACGDRTLGERLGLDKRAPDEFAIVKRAPLVIPPDYSLRPPRPGEPRPQEPTAPELARAALTGQPTAPFGAAAAASPGQRALLDGAGAAEADPAIRERIAAEAGAPGADDRSLFGRLFDFGGGPAPGGDVVDAAAEAERLRDAREEGLPPTAGETPIAGRGDDSDGGTGQPSFETLGGQTSLGTVGEQGF